MPYHVLDADVWRRLEATPGFNERMREAEAELAAGRGVLYRIDKRGRLRKARKRNG